MGGTRLIPKLYLIQQGFHWWITGNKETGAIGPYPNKKEAEDDRRGLMRFYRNHNQPGFATSETVNAKRNK